VGECEHEGMYCVLPNTLIDFIGMIMLISLIFNLYLQKKSVYFFCFLKIFCVAVSALIKAGHGKAHFLFFSFFLKYVKLFSFFFLTKILKIL
jgi:hypothetical protein